MIRNNWYAVELSKGVKAKPVRLKRFGENLVIWRSRDGKLNCLLDSCAHRGAALSAGRIVDDCIECPYHGFRYNDAGRCTVIPAHGKAAPVPKSLKIKRFPIEEAKGLIWVWWGDDLPELPKLPWFEDLKDDEAPYVEAARETPLSPCRFMEANLDFAHFVFVHKLFKIPGAGPVAKEFKMTVKDNLIRVWGAFGPDSDFVAKKPPARFDGSVLFPALATYETPGTDNRSVVAMAPVDQNTSWFTYRIYLKKGPLTAIRKFVTDLVLLKIIFKRFLHPQDLAVSKLQEPAESGLARDLLVSSADQGIRQFLKMWQAALGTQAEQAKARRAGASKRGKAALERGLETPEYELPFYGEVNPLEASPSQRLNLPQEA